MAQETKVYGRYCELLRKIGKARRRTGGAAVTRKRHGRHRSHFDGHGSALADVQVLCHSRPRIRRLAHVGEEIRRPIARGISDLVRNNLQYEPEK